MEQAGPMDPGMGGLPGGGLPPAELAAAEGPAPGGADMGPIDAPQSREQARQVVGQLIAQFGDAETALEELLIAGIEGGEGAMDVEAEEPAAPVDEGPNPIRDGGY